MRFCGAGLFTQRFGLLCDTLPQRPLFLLQLRLRRGGADDSGIGVEDGRFIGRGGDDDDDDGGDDAAHRGAV